MRRLQSYAPVDMTRSWFAGTFWAGLQEQTLALLPAKCIDRKILPKSFPRNFLRLPRFPNKHLMPMQFVDCFSLQVW